MDCSTPAFPVLTTSQSLLKLMSIESVMPSNHLVICHPLLLWPSIFPSIRVFSNESALCIWWPTNLLFTSGGQSIGFSFSISPSNDSSGLISFRIGWFAVQGTLKRPLVGNGERSVFFLLEGLHSEAVSFRWVSTPGADNSFSRVVSQHWIEAFN